MKVLITGITGQDGSYLAELLTRQGHEVHGVVRRVAVENDKDRMSRLYVPGLVGLQLHGGDVTNYGRMYQIIHKVKPNVIYHLAAQSFVAESFKDPFTTLNVNVNGTLNILECIKEIDRDIKFYFAGSSEQFGQVVRVPQDERTPFHPRSPYGVSKVAGYELTRNYREAYDMFACAGILFNHESPRRGLEFVTRKITSTAAKILQKKEKKLVLGNMKAARDWGHAKDYVKAMTLMMEYEQPKDFVIGTNETHTILEFVEITFDYLGLDMAEYVTISDEFYRPAEVDLLQGNAEQAEYLLKWEREYSFKDLVTEMIEADIKILW